MRIERLYATMYVAYCIVRGFIPTKKHANYWMWRKRNDATEQMKLSKQDKWSWQLFYAEIRDYYERIGGKARLKSTTPFSK